MPTTPPDYVHLLPFDQSLLEPLHELQNEGEPNFVVGLIRDFVEQYKEMSEDIFSADTVRDLPRLEGAAHKLKSSAAVLGLTKLAAICANIENCARSSGPTKSLIEALREAAATGLGEMKLYAANQRP